MIKILTCLTLGYVDGLMDLLFDEVIKDPAPYVAELKKIPVPENLCAQFERPGKDLAVAGYVSRFIPGEV